MNEQMNVKLTLHLPYVLVLELTELIVTIYSNFIITICITFVFWMYSLKLVSRLHYFNTCFQKSLGIPNKCCHNQIQGQTLHPLSAYYSSPLHLGQSWKRCLKYTPLH